MKAWFSSIAMAASLTGCSAQSESNPDLGPRLTDSGTTSADAGSASVPFTNGSRELAHVVNIVDAPAAAELAAYLAGCTGNLPLSANAFFQYYLDEYDFLFFVPDHRIDGGVAGCSRVVNREPRVGTGDTWEEHRPGYASAGRLKSVIGLQWLENQGLFPPTSHETMHYWANHLDPSLGFGPGTVEKPDSHWGYTGLFGVLGGFDPKSLRCRTPAGALPPDCAQEADGSTRYLVGLFYPSDNTARVQTFAPLELYLMGLIPDSEVPSSYQVLTDAQQFPDTIDATAGTIEVAAKGIKTILFSSVLAFHGIRTLEPESARHFAAAFVIVSEQPVSDAVMQRVGTWADAFGNHMQFESVPSFEALTGGRATMTARVGRRRTSSEEVAPLSVQPTCSLLRQECGPGLGCYFYRGAPRCALAGSLQKGASCDGARLCEPGFDCARAGTSYACAELCDAGSTASIKPCATYCTLGFTRVVDTAGNLVAAYCTPF